MRTHLKRIALLALAVVAILLLHDRVRKGTEAAKQPPEPEETAEETQEETQSMSVLRMGGGTALGQLRENTEQGGVDIVVDGAEGTEVYTFTDVSIDSWYADAVNFAVSAGLMTGVGNEPVFRPEYGVLRESFAVILYRFTDGRIVEPRTRFEDVPEDSWFYDAVNWVTNEHLMSAPEFQNFGVGEYMTCEQTLVSLYRVAGSPETDGSLADYPYAAKVSETGRNAVDWAWKSGLIAEDECVWYPTQAISRAQVAQLLMRMSAMA